MEFLFVFGMMWVVVAVIYTALFSVGTGVKPQEEARETAKEAEVHATVHHIPHAA